MLLLRHLARFWNFRAARTRRWRTGLCLFAVWLASFGCNRGNPLIAIARALACRPAVLLCDEITSALDPAGAASVLTLLHRLRSETGLAMVVVTHDTEVAAQLPGSQLSLGTGPDRRPVHA